MFVDGEWCDAASGATVEATSPATGESLGPVAEGDRDGRAPGDRRRQRRLPRLGGPHRLRARRPAPPCGRRLRAPGRRAGPHPHPRPGQAAQGGGRGRGRRADRVLPHGRRGRQAPDRHDPGERRARPARAAAAPPARRARADHPLELALHDARRGARAGARLRQLRRLDAGAFDRGLLRRAGRMRRGGRPAAGRVQHGARPGPRGGRRAGGQPRHPGGGLHRLHGDRADRRQASGRQGAAARDGRQRARSW